MLNCFRSKKGYRYLNGMSLIVFLFYSTIANAQDASTLWVNHIGGPKSNESVGITHDAHGNSYTTGMSGDAVNFDPNGSNFSLSGSAGFLCKYDPDGKFVWAKRIGEKGINTGRAIKADDFGNIYVTGMLGDATSFYPGGPVLGPRGMFVLKLDTSGNFIWARNMGANGFIMPNAIDVDKYGNVYTTGEFAGPLDMNPSGNPVIINSASLNDVFVAKVDSSGNLEWAKGFGGNKVDRGYSIAVDDWGNVYTTGEFRDTVDFNPDPNQEFKVVASTSNNEAFISKLDAQGNFVWTKTFVGDIYSNPSGEGHGIRIDYCGNIYSTGYFRGTVNFDPDTTTNQSLSGVNAMYLSKLDSSGKFLWVKSAGRSIFPFSMEMDQQGSCYITGRFSGRMNFNPGQNPADTFFLTSVKYDDAFILKLTANGDFAWATSFGSDVADQGRSLSIDKGNNVYATGIFQKNVIFSPPTFSNTILQGNPGGYDIYIMKINQKCEDTSSYLMEVNLCEESFSLNCHTYIESGTYTQTFTNSKNCDSVLTIQLSLNDLIKPVINVNVFELSTVLSYSTYQWYFNGSPLVGETNRTLHVDKNGNYTVAVTSENGCTDTSDIYKVTNVTGILNERSLVQIDIFPNPVKDVIYIRSEVSVNAFLFHIDGREIKFIENAKSISTHELPKGIYLLKIFDKKENLFKVEKVIKL